ncbi:BLUF domain-containing protein [Amaricoccus sp.]|uniref:BLUF domain-containing protein n=1 Tax=Amaricoccus sp. TaxID=1872485 RepID=UPI001B60E25E|nr:BLUF domain-containing protein [Amaricoccus sp.]MBP7000753.1 BLUF domain-containing protein [Amaricoccus sp.]
MAGSPAAAEPDLVRLVYVSVATRPLGPEELEAIAAAARRNNPPRGLTGLLLYGGGRFYGLLEGTERRVLGRMERIVADPRHKAIRVLREDPIRARRFAEWSFGPLPLTAGGEEDLAALDRFLVSVRR